MKIDWKSESKEVFDIIGL